MRTRIPSVVLASFAAACLMQAVATAGDEALDSLIQRLASPDPRDREEASALLARDESLGLHDIEAILLERELLPEQRNRLLAIAQQRFARSARAAMGVRFGGHLSNRIVIGQTYQPFPCVDLLEPGDVIVEAAGVRLRGSNTQTVIRSLIIARDPGELLPVVVRRGAEEIRLEVPLGGFEELPSSTLTGADLELAWRVRSAAYRWPGGTQPVAAPVPLRGWVSERDAFVRDRNRDRRWSPDRDADTWLVGAGSTLGGGGISADEVQRMVKERGKDNVGIDERAINPMALAGIPIGPYRRGVLSVSQELDSLIQTRSDVEAALRDLESGEGFDGANEETREVWRRDRLDELRLIDKQIAAIRADADSVGRREDEARAAAEAAARPDE